jgi:hypothetical protein
VNPPAIPDPVAAFAPEFARRLGLILRMLADIVARRLLREPRFVALIVPLWRRINRSLQRVERLMAGIAAGRLPRPSLPRPSLPRPDRPDRLPSPIPRGRGRGWLVAVLGYEAAGCASQLRALLADPEAAALLALVPTVGRLIAPVGRMLEPGARQRPSSRAIPVAAPQYCALPPMLSTEFGRRRPAEPWHYHHVVRGKPA